MTQSILLFLFVAAIYVALPAVIIWGWVRWLKRTQPRTWPALLSLVGFALASTFGHKCQNGSKGGAWAQFGHTERKDPEGLLRRADAAYT